MPELPEVEHAAGVLRRASRGKTVARVVAFHPSFRKRLPGPRAKLVRDRRVVKVERRGKHQIMHVEGDVVIVAHFRLDGDWELDRVTDTPSRFARGAIEFTDGSRINLVDPRALATLTVHRAAEAYLPALGPDPTSADLDVDAVCAALGKRAISIKQALLDQKLLAGVGNIYAAEALWLAKIDPRLSARSLSKARCVRLLDALREVLSTGDRTSARYRTAGNSRIRIYDNEGNPCPKCRTPIRRITQGARSTWFCPTCQTRR